MSVARRIGLDEHGTDVLVWLVRNHLLLADTATRRDLSDPATITRFARAVGDAERLDLLYVLTIGDSRATGPAAWSTSKAALVRELFVKTDTLFEEGVVVSRDRGRSREPSSPRSSGPQPTSTSTRCRPRTRRPSPPTSSPGTAS